MKYIVYGILRAAEDVEQQLPALAEAESVCLMASGDLVAAISVAPPAGPPDAKRHAQIVQMLHEVCTVLPMRCGIGFQTEAEVHALLQDHAEEFRASLAALQGCEEMGLRVLCSVPAAPSPARAAEPLSGPRAYLASRKVYYASQDAERRALLHVAGRMQRPFDGLFGKCKMTPLSSDGTPILSLQFLVRRSDTERFRDAFRRLQQHTPEKILLTGPWPPYHFATLDSASLLRV